MRLSHLARGRTDSLVLKLVHVLWLVLLRHFLIVSLEVLDIVVGFNCHYDGADGGKKAEQRHKLEEMIEEVAITLSDLTVINLLLELSSLLRKPFFNCDLSWLVAVYFIVGVIVFRFVMHHL